MNMFSKRLDTNTIWRLRLTAGWLFLGHILLTAAILFWQGAIVWPSYALLVVVIGLIPVLVYRDLRALPPFETILLCAAPFTLRAVSTGFIASHTLSYLSAGAIALLIFAELDAFTSFKTTHAVTLPLVTLTTIAAAGAWAVARWSADVLLGTHMIRSESLLMWEFVLATVTGLLAAELFHRYIHRLDAQVMRP